MQAPPSAGAVPRDLVNEELPAHYVVDVLERRATALWLRCKLMAPEALRPHGLIGKTCTASARLSGTLFGDRISLPPASLPLSSSCYRGSCCASLYLSLPSRHAEPSPARHFLQVMLVWRSATTSVGKAEPLTLDEPWEVNWKYKSFTMYAPHKSVW